MQGAAKWACQCSTAPPFLQLYTLVWPLSCFDNQPVKILKWPIQTGNVAISSSDLSFLVSVEERKGQAITTPILDHQVAMQIVTIQTLIERDGQAHALGSLVSQQRMKHQSDAACEISAWFMDHRQTVERPQKSRFFLLQIHGQKCTFFNLIV